MEREILIGSNSDLVVEQMQRQLKAIFSDLQIGIISDFSAIESLSDRQMVIIDLSVYTSGIIDRIQQFKSRFPRIELIAITHADDMLIDQLLVWKGIDQVASREELPCLVSKHLNYASNLQPSSLLQAI